MRTITQRQLGNDSAATVRDVQAGQSVIVTRNGTPVPVRSNLRRAACARRTSRRRVADLLIGATALAHGLPLDTRNPADLAGLGDLITVLITVDTV